MYMHSNPAYASDKRQLSIGVKEKKSTSLWKSHKPAEFFRRFSNLPFFG